MTTNGIGDDYVRRSEPATNSCGTEGADLNSADKMPMIRKRQSVTKSRLIALESSTSVVNGLRSTPTPNLKKNSRKTTFAAGEFITPGAVADDPSSSTKPSAGEMRWKSRAAERRKSEANNKRELRKVASIDHPAQADERRKRSQQNYAENGNMQQEKFREAFLIFDRDCDGRITSAEMTRVMQSLGYRPSEGEIAEMLDKADINRNGTIEFEEFIQVMVNQFSDRNGDQGRYSPEQELQDMFEIFDLNKDGRITAQELHYAMRTLGENLSSSELEDMMRTADSNGDGVIDFQEFQGLFRLCDRTFSSPSANVAVITH